MHPLFFHYQNVLLINVLILSNIANQCTPAQSLNYPCYLSAYKCSDVPLTVCQITLMLLFCYSKHDRIHISTTGLMSICISTTRHIYHTSGIRDSFASFMVAAYLVWEVWDSSLLFVYVRNNINKPCTNEVLASQTMLLCTACPGLSPHCSTSAQYHCDTQYTSVN